ncbi:TIGR04282 family arsenosugar biosynthesis glycosyltransferase [Sphaerisporangium fuscum]|uniref:TIGR04282 family arsenosugar biosynthesis glycosyltransferase n=1 Tax=Sphaerisporangium fuscum TaxID=2835868 RepID=UPI001BDD8412|nr:DUF2064 domain-containing protein [Sphaerisporangium fuscum]
MSVSAPVPGRREGRIVVMAKEPVPGRVKTRLTPPYTPEEAAGLAAAALGDTLRAVAAVPARRVLALEGIAGPWLPAGFTVLRQRGRGLDERLAAAFEDVGRPPSSSGAPNPGREALPTTRPSSAGGSAVPAPVVLIGMDTPQVTPGLLSTALAMLHTRDAVFGPAADGGFWLLGLRVPGPRLLLGVPMSLPHTGAAQLERLAEAGLDIGLMPCLTDVDTAADAAEVASQAPDTMFAATLAGLGARL